MWVRFILWTIAGLTVELALCQVQTSAPESRPVDPESTYLSSTMSHQTLSQTIKQVCKHTPVSFQSRKLQEVVTFLLRC